MGSLSNYTITFTHSTEGSREITPDNSELIIVDKLEDGEKFYRRTLDSTFILSGADYAWLKAIEDDPVARCIDITVTIQTVVSATTHTPLEGVVRMNQVKFNERDGIAEVKPEPDDDYRELYENWETKINILSGTTKTTVNTFIGELEIQECGPDSAFDIFPSSLPENTSCLTLGGSPPDSLGWTLVRNRTQNMTPAASGTPGLYDATSGHTTIWAREKVTGAATAPPGAGWISLGGMVYVREIPKQFDYSQYIFDPDGIGVCQVVFTLEGIEELNPSLGTYEYEVQEFDNGVELTEVLDALNPITGGTFISDFYQINPDATAPSNDAYTEASDYHTKLIFFDITDITRWDAGQNATIAETTFKDLYEFLKNKHNVFLTITGTTIRIEHESYYNSVEVEGLDLTSGVYPIQILGRKEYDYGDLDLPKEERFTGLDSPVSSYFEGDPILYTKCIGEKSAIETFDTPEYITDLGYINQNTDDISVEGFFVAACLDYDGQVYIHQLAGRLNGPLAMTKLHDKFWRHGRPQLEGNLTGQM
jgi:hypothetical protein